ncbi:AraC family transcriptional regulator [Novipirellula caenicola]|uniref:HTH-type transcriptional activator RhaS n=1 Tax=Novipirellula caenicola TaxID=1536901 RepID=A0ABP9VNE1_9BACT
MIQAESIRGTNGNENSFKSNFFNQMEPSDQIQTLFDYVPGISFFVKDEQSRMVSVSQSIVDRFGFEHEDEVIGRTDYDFFPAHIADSFVRDDQQVIRTGEPMIDRVEIWYTEQRMLDWFVTTKLPVYGKQRAVIGIMGVIRSYEGHRKTALPYSQISGVVEHIRENHRGRITVAELAQRANLSTRQLHRKFMDVFGMSVQDFLMKTRMQAACDELIHTHTSIVDIANQLGFCDQSAFTQQFRKHIGVTPSRFRRQHRLS